MTRLEAFGVQIFLLMIVVIFGIFLLSGYGISPDAKGWIERIWDIILVLLSPPAFAKAIQSAYEKEKPNETPVGSGSTPTV